MMFGHLILKPHAHPEEILGGLGLALICWLLLKAHNRWGAK